MASTVESNVLIGTTFTNGSDTLQYFPAPEALQSETYVTIRADANTNLKSGRDEISEGLSVVRYASSNFGLYPLSSKWAGTFRVWRSGDTSFQTWDPIGNTDDYPAVAVGDIYLVLDKTTGKVYSMEIIDFPANSVACTYNRTLVGTYALSNADLDLGLDLYTRYDTPQPSAVTVNVIVKDTYGDGWNGNWKMVMKDPSGATIYEETGPASSDGSAELVKPFFMPEATANTDCTIEWESKGSWASEVKCRLEDLDGNILATCDGGLGLATPQTFTAPSLVSVDPHLFDATVHVKVSNADMDNGVSFNAIKKDGSIKVMVEGDFARQILVEDLTGAVLAPTTFFTDVTNYIELTLPGYTSSFTIYRRSDRFRENGAKVVVAPMLTVSAQQVTTAGDISVTLTAPDRATMLTAAGDYNGTRDYGGIICEVSTRKPNGSIMALAMGGTGDDNKGSGYKTGIIYGGTFYQSLYTGMHATKARCIVREPGNWARERKAKDGSGAYNLNNSLTMNLTQPYAHNPDERYYSRKPADVTLKPNQLHAFILDPREQMGIGANADYEQYFFTGDVTAQNFHITYDSDAGVLKNGLGDTLAANVLVDDLITHHGALMTVDDISEWDLRADDAVTTFPLMSGQTAIRLMAQNGDCSITHKASGLSYTIDFTITENTNVSIANVATPASNVVTATINYTGLGSTPKRVAVALVAMLDTTDSQYLNKNGSEPWGVNPGRVTDRVRMQLESTDTTGVKDYYLSSYDIANYRYHINGTPHAVSCLMDIKELYLSGDGSASYDIDIEADAELMMELGIHHKYALIADYMLHDSADTERNHLEITGALLETNDTGEGENFAFGQSDNVYIFSNSFIRSFDPSMQKLRDGVYGDDYEYYETKYDAAAGTLLRTYPNGHGKHNKPREQYAFYLVAKLSNTKVPLTVNDTVTKYCDRSTTYLSAISDFEEAYVQVPSGKWVSEIVFATTLYYDLQADGGTSRMVSYVAKGSQYAAQIMSGFKLHNNAFLEEGEEYCIISEAVLDVAGGSYAIGSVYGTYPYYEYPLVGPTNRDGNMVDNGDSDFNPNWANTKDKLPAGSYEDAGYRIRRAAAPVFTIGTYIDPVSNVAAGQTYESILGADVNPNLYMPMGTATRDADFIPRMPDDPDRDTLNFGSLDWQDRFVYDVEVTDARFGDDFRIEADMVPAQDIPAGAFIRQTFMIVDGGDKAVDSYVSPMTVGGSGFGGWTKYTHTGTATIQGPTWNMNAFTAHTRQVNYRNGEPRKAGVPFTAKVSARHWEDKAALRFYKPYNSYHIIVTNCGNYMSNGPEKWNVYDVTRKADIPDPDNPDMSLVGIRNVHELVHKIFPIPDSQIVDKRESNGRLVVEGVVLGNTNGYTDGVRPVLKVVDGPMEYHSEFNFMYTHVMNVHPTDGMYPLEIEYADNCVMNLDGVKSATTSNWTKSSGMSLPACYFEEGATFTANQQLNYDAIDTNVLKNILTSGGLQYMAVCGSNTPADRSEDYHNRVKRLFGDYDNEVRSGNRRNANLTDMGYVKNISNDISYPTLGKCVAHNAVFDTARSEITVSYRVEDKPVIVDGSSIYAGFYTPTIPENGITSDLSTLTFNDVMKPADDFVYWSGGTVFTGNERKPHFMMLCDDGKLCSELHTLAFGDHGFTSGDELPVGEEFDVTFTLHESLNLSGPIRITAGGQPSRVDWVGNVYGGAFLEDPAHEFAPETIMKAGQYIDVQVIARADSTEDDITSVVILPNGLPAISAHRFGDRVDLSLNQTLKIVPEVKGSLRIKYNGVEIPAGAQPDPTSGSPRTGSDAFDYFEIVLDTEGTLELISTADTNRVNEIPVVDKTTIDVFIGVGDMNIDAIDEDVDHHYKVPDLTQIEYSATSDVPAASLLHALRHMRVETLTDWSAAEIDVSDRSSIVVYSGPDDGYSFDPADFGLDLGTLPVQEMSAKFSDAAQNDVTLPNGTTIKMTKGDAQVAAVLFKALGCQMPLSNGNDNNIRRLLPRAATENIVSFAVGSVGGVDNSGNTQTLANLMRSAKSPAGEYLQYEDLDQEWSKPASERKVGLELMAAIMSSFPPDKNNVGPADSEQSIWVADPVNPFLLTLNRLPSEINLQFVVRSALTVKDKQGSILIESNPSPSVATPVDTATTLPADSHRVLVQYNFKFTDHITRYVIVNNDDTYTYPVTYTAPTDKEGYVAMQDNSGRTFFIPVDTGMINTQDPPSDTTLIVINDAATEDALTLDLISDSADASVVAIRNTDTGLYSHCGAHEYGDLVDQFGRNGGDIARITMQYDRSEISLWKVSDTPVEVYVSNRQDHVHSVKQTGRRVAMTDRHTGKLVYLEYEVAAVAQDYIRESGYNSLYAETGDKHVPHPDWSLEKYGDWWKSMKGYDEESKHKSTAALATLAFPATTFELSKKHLPPGKYAWVVDPPRFQYWFDTDPNTTLAYSGPPIQMQGSLGSSSWDILGKVETHAGDYQQNNALVFSVDGNNVAETLAPTATLATTSIDFPDYQGLVDANATGIDLQMVYGAYNAKSNRVGAAFYNRGSGGWKTDDHLSAAVPYHPVTTYPTGTFSSPVTANSLTMGLYSLSTEQKTVTGGDKLAEDSTAVPGINPAFAPYYYPVNNSFTGFEKSFDHTDGNKYWFDKLMAMRMVPNDVEGGDFKVVATKIGYNLPVGKYVLMVDCPRTFGPFSVVGLDGFTPILNDATGTPVVPHGVYNNGTIVENGEAGQETVIHEATLTNNAVFFEVTDDSEVSFGSVADFAPGATLL